jgi:hypothetical protein
MNDSIKKGFGFGLTSGVITTLGLIVGLHSSTNSTLAVIGGKDEFGVPIDEIGEFNVKLMKFIPTDWRLSKGLSGFASCVLKKGSVALCGGNDGQ